MPLSLVLDRDASQPLYRQIASQIRQQIRDGRLPVGTKLPAIRPMADKLGVTRLTVQTAYDELRSQGWIQTVVGKGTFVAETARPEDLMNQVGLSANRARVLDDLERIEQISIVRSLAGAEPDPDLFPAGEFWGMMNQLKSDIHLMRYNWPQGDPELRKALSGLLRDRGIEAMPDGIIVTSGVTQGLALIVQALTRPGDFVAVERPTHLGVLHTLEANKLHPVAVPMDEDGPRLDILERLIAQYRPRFFLTFPNFHNPTGTQISDERRQKLLELARHFGFLIVEDDTRGLLAYDDDPKPALKASDEADLVIYLSSLSKLLMPGLRVGYIVAPRPLHEELINLKRAVDYCGPPFVQRAVANFIADGALRRHLHRVIPVYRGRRDRLLQSLSTNMSPGVAWTRPKGGFACWLTLPEGVDAMDVIREALRRGFAFTPGDAFLTRRGPTGHLRICFGAQPERVIEEAAEVLARVIDEKEYFW